MNTKKLNVLNKYDIIFERGCLGHCGDMVRTAVGETARKAAVVTDDNVAPLYLDTVTRSLESANFEVCTFVFNHGEQNKNIATVMKMVKFFAENGLTRTDIAVALGGGVCGDMCGFAAAIYLRGIRFVQMPTSLLAQVDSSVGGKTGCDLDCGKNLVGAFHHPSLVLIDADALSTLPPSYLADGMGEVIKTACIRSASLAEQLEKSGKYEEIDNIIYQCVQIKAQVVENDFTEKGERMLLNFGHTIGHAIEKLENFSGISHGMAVGVGMVAVCRAAERSGLTKTDCADRICALLNKYDMPTSTDHDSDAIAEAAMKDKKKLGGRLNLVLLHNIGDAYIYGMDSNRFADFLRR